MCEFRVDGKLQVLPVEASKLSWLPGKPSNFPLPDQTCDDAIAGQNSNAGQGGTESPWQVGALVRLLDTSSSGSSVLAPGRGARSIGCISGVNLEDNKVSVCVSADAGSCLSYGDVKIGAQVCLALGYAQVQNASKGPLNAGQQGSVKALQDGLVLVESSGQDKVKALWWYAPEALALASTSGLLQQMPVQKNHSVCCDIIGSSNPRNKGVFFNVVNTSSDPIRITTIEAGAFAQQPASPATGGFGAFGASPATGGFGQPVAGPTPPMRAPRLSHSACLFACKHGACAGHETDSSSWRVVWKGELSDMSATSCPRVFTLAGVRLAPGEVQGFLLHCEQASVCYSSEDK
jgi:hypothetical protein